MTTKMIERAAQDEAVRVYRDRFGYPRLEQPDDRDAGAALIVILCAAGMVAAWVIGMALS